MVLRRLIVSWVLLNISGVLFDVLSNISGVLFDIYEYIWSLQMILDMGEKQVGGGVVERDFFENI